MKPEIFNIFGLPFHAYTTAISIAFVTCTLLIVRRAERLDPPLYISTHGGIYAFLSALIGAKAFYIVQYKSPWKLYQAFYIWIGGLVYYGGLIGAVLALIIYFWWVKAPHFRTGDVAIVFLPLGQAITRIGCFLNGCCWGQVAPEGLPWAVWFPKGSFAYEDHLTQHLLTKKAAHSLAVHPTQLYMVVGLSLVFLVLLWGLDRKRFDGAMLLLYCLLYGVLRFVVEGLRGDSVRSIPMVKPEGVWQLITGGLHGEDALAVYHLTVSQTISLGLVLFALIMFVILHKLPIRLRAPSTETPAETGEPAEDIAEVEES